MKPAFLITIDTEGDNLWSKSDTITTNNSNYLPRFHELCIKYKFRPTYLTNYEMAVCPIFKEFARNVIKSNTGEIGMHLHAWNSPPIINLTSNDYYYHPYLIEYDRKGIIDIELESSGSGYDKFWIPAGGLRLPKSDSTSVEITDNRGNLRTANDIEMDGYGVWAFINSVVPKQVDRLLKRNNINKIDVDQFIFHQASQLTLESIMKLMKLNEEQVFINIHNIGNTVSSSIPIAIKDAIEHNKINIGSTIILSGFGVGLSYGTILMEY